jgi:plastocyanin
VASALAVLLCSMGPDAAAETRKPVTHVVLMEAVALQPAVLTIRVGDSVVWQNKDPFPHTATSAVKAFDSGNVAAGASWTYTPRTRGEFPYVCTLHPTMKGILRVQ